MPVEFFLVMVALLIGLSVLGIYIFRKIKPKIEGLSEHRNSESDLSETWSNLSSKIEGQLNGTQNLHTQTESEEQQDHLKLPSWRIHPTMNWMTQTTITSIYLR